MHHGGDLSEAMIRYGGRQQDWLDLSTGINPHAYPVPRTLSQSSWTQLPSRKPLEDLLAAARQAYQVPETLSLFAAPGTQALIAQLPSILNGKHIAILGPTYSSHSTSFARSYAQVSEIQSLNELPETADTLLIVNPNNPDGRVLPPDLLLTLAKTMKDRGGWLIIDEAFCDITPSASVLVALSQSPDTETPDNLIVLRSFGKFYGLAGLRLGFMAAHATVTSKMAARFDDWCVSGPALELGRIALEDQAWRNSMCDQLAKEMAELKIVLLTSGLTFVGETPLYILMETGNAAALHDHLARQHIWTRVFDYSDHWMRFGLPGSTQGLERLSQALAAYSPAS